VKILPSGVAELKGVPTAAAVGLGDTWPLGGLGRPSVLPSGVKGAMPVTSAGSRADFLRENIRDMRRRVLVRLRPLPVANGVEGTTSVVAKPLGAVELAPVVAVDTDGDSTAASPTVV
jgi:hypothetical protein